MNILFCGDIVGRSGRDVLIANLPQLKQDLQLDFIVANGENAAHGFGITKSICKDLFSAGVDVITTGNHVWDQKEVIGFIDQEPRLLRPLNYPTSTPGRGYNVYSDRKGRKILVANPMARLFMEPLDDPFSAVDTLLKSYPLGGAVQAILIDFHGEATSEKMAMGHFCDGRASLVVGTHSHIPTADAQILPGGTGYLTDAGMCGDYNSVIGMDKGVPIHRFTRKTPTDRMSPATGPGTLCGVFIEINESTGLPFSIQRLCLGARLSNVMPTLSR